MAVIVTVTLGRRRLFKGTVREALNLIVTRIRRNRRTLTRLTIQPQQP